MDEGPPATKPKRLNGRAIMPRTFSTNFPRCKGPFAIPSNHSSPVPGAEPTPRWEVLAKYRVVYLGVLAPQAATRCLSRWGTPPQQSRRVCAKAGGGGYGDRAVGTQRVGSSRAENIGPFFLGGIWAFLVRLGSDGRPKRTALLFLDVQASDFRLDSEKVCTPPMYCSCQAHVSKPP